MNRPGIGHEPLGSVMEIDEESGRNLSKDQRIVVVPFRLFRQTRQH